MQITKLKPYMMPVFAIIWFCFTVSLVTWWWVFFLSRFEASSSDVKVYHMFAWEGSILLAALLAGGFTLIVFTFRDRKRHERLRFFFSTFSHDIKTSITRLRLQAEVIEEDRETEKDPVIKRLVQDILRLDLQLENSLLMANVDDVQLMMEKISFKGLLSHLRNEFPDLSIELEKEVFLFADRRALLSVFRNLLQNSTLHGHANRIEIKVVASGSNIKLTVSDNGSGYKGAISKLGSEILISSSTQGNGIGLLLTKHLMKKMRGDIHFKSTENQGFQSIIELEGYL